MYVFQLCAFYVLWHGKNTYFKKSMEMYSTKITSVCLQDRTIKHINTGQCLQKPGGQDTTQPLLRSCDHSLGQQWIMKSKFVWQASKLP
jgi:hypothetical protein